MSLRRSCPASHAMGVRQPGNSNLLPGQGPGNRENPGKLVSYKISGYLNLPPI
jgi:hypothetical protein